jgi:manganese transport protein
VHAPSATGILGGLAPRFDGADSVLLAASMLGATVMPHAIYVHSALARDRHGRPESPDDTRRLLKITRWDVAIALGLAGLINLGMLVLAAVNLRGLTGANTIVGASAAIGHALGAGIAVVFAIGLLASGLASTSVGSYAGATIMAGLLRRRIPLLLRRVLTLIPALIVLGFGADPTAALVISQVVLSFGIPFALVPLLRLTGDPAVMGEHSNSRLVRVALAVIVVLVVALNLALIVLAVVPGA